MYNLTRLVLISTIYFSFEGRAEDNPVDYSKLGIEELGKMADLGNPNALLYLGYCYDEGKGVVVDHAKALTYYNLAVSKGSIEAHHYIGLLYYDGTGVKKSYSTAIEHFLLSANDKNTESMAHVGLIYMSGGFGVTADAEKAVEWMRRASLGGDEKAKKVLPILEAIPALHALQSDMRNAKKTHAEIQSLDYKAIENDLKKSTASNVADAKAIVLQKLPSIGVKDSPENILFTSWYQRDQVNNKEVFRDPRWPLLYGAKIASLGGAIRTELIGGKRKGWDVFWIVNRLSAEKLKMLLGPPQLSFEDGRVWLYKKAIVDPVTENPSNLSLRVDSIFGVTQFSEEGGDWHPHY